MTVRLRHLARVNPSTPEFDGLEDDAEVAFLPLEAVWPGDRFDATRRRPKAEMAVGYTRFREGDILVPKITPTFQADRTVIAHGFDGCVGAGTTELHVVRAGDSADARYLRYLLSSKPFLDEGEASMIGVAGQKRVPDECLRDLRVPVVTLDRQRAIADYLDAETTRIDALIEKKRRMVEVLVDRQAALIEQTIRSLAAEWGVRPLKYSVRKVEVGIVIKPSELYAIEGVPTIRGFNVKPGRIELRDIATISHEGDRMHAKSRLRSGDVVVVRTGQAGAAAVVPDALDGYNCIDLVIIRPSAVLDAKYLEFVLNSDWTQKYIDEHSVGTIQTHFNVGAMKEVPIPVPDMEMQRRVIEHLSSDVRCHGRFIEILHRQVDLLVEHRQALITAAVTGELPIPGLAA